LVQQKKGWKIFRDPFLRDSSKEGPEMIWIPAGSFLMGDIQGEGDNDEKPVHKVSIKRFAMGRYEVTVGEFRQFIEATGYQTEAEKGYGCQVASQQGLLEIKEEDANWRNPYFPLKDNQPVVCVSWHDALAYTQWLSRQKPDKPIVCLVKLSGSMRPMPKRKRYFGGGIISAKIGLIVMVVVVVNGIKKWPPSVMANLFCLYDTAGNVWEWVADPWHSSYQDAPSDDRVWEEKGNHCLRVIRGGAWNEKPNNLRVAYRHGRGFIEGSFDSRRVNLGFRIIKLEKSDHSQNLVAKLTPVERERLCEREKRTEFTKEPAKVKAFEVAQRYIEKGRIS
jgi:hypothetical protein